MSKNSTTGAHEEWLNYHHLHYFWRIAREGSLARAAREVFVLPVRSAHGQCSPSDRRKACTARK